MKRNVAILGSLVLLFGLTQAALAQPADDGGRRPPPGPPGNRGPQVDRPLHPILMALDADRDGELSEAEIANASAALAKLDQNKDGKLSRQELRPRRPEGVGDRPGRSPEAFVQRLMSRDENGDGKLSQEELPPQMQENFARLDANGDGYVDRAEAAALAGRRRPGGPPEGRDRPARPEPEN